MKIQNKKAKLNYNVLKEYEAGIVMDGASVKSFRKGMINLDGAYAKVIGEEVYLLTTKDKYKLLLHKKEILSIKAEIKAKNLTLIPMEMYTKARLIKVKLALAKSKRKHEKRETIKKRDIKREIEQQIKSRGRI